jgi:membrane protein YqaA with SNARE-associated domain
MATVYGIASFRCYSNVRLKVVIAHIALFFASLGGVGILLMGILDGTLLFFPLGLDLLLVALTARHHDRWLYYAAMAAAGSVIGSFTTDWVGRKGGEAGLERRLSKRRLQFIQTRVQASSGVALAISAVAPPGFPFTPVVLVAAALKYPRAKLLGIVAVFRLVRFTVEALLAVKFGPKVLKIAESKTAEVIILGVVSISLAGTIWVIISWWIQSRKRDPGRPLPHGRGA